MAKLVVGENDLQTLYPEVAAEWDDEANGDLTPQDVTAHSNKKVYWKCAKGHSWPAAIYCRTNGTQCPFCSGRKAWPGETDLATLYPEIAAEWNYEANGGLTPQNVTAHSGKKVHWRCLKKGHEWEETVSQRVNGCGCPFCSGHRVAVGETDLATLYPEIAAEWDYEANGELTPQSVTAHSAKMVYWRCSKGHSWPAVVYSRTRGYNCPFCSGQKALIGETDLATLYPEIAAEWDYEANGDETPQNVTAHSGKKFYWKCAKGHSWQAAVFTRTRGSQCPVCLGRRLLPGENDLATLYPEIAAEWDYEANAPLTPQQVFPKSNKAVFWICRDCGRQWKTKIVKRVEGCGCPYAAGKIPIEGENDLATVNPELAAQWDYEANAPLTPQKVFPNSKKRVGWVCPNCGNRWETMICTRNKGSNCPACHGRG